MDIIINKIKTNDYLTKSNLPASDYVINSYTGCLHGCKYCYACFMKRFTNHKEDWGSFIDIKECDKPININKLKGKSVFISSVTDCYNPIEKECKLTRNILKQLIKADAKIDITTKSSLVLRDIDIIKQLKNAQVAISINTINENFKNDMDKASSIKERIETLKTLHENGIRTVLFMSPIFPEITEWKEIIITTKNFVDEYWFENLNLRGSYKFDILKYVFTNYPKLTNLYREIYINENKDYWKNLEIEINKFCKDNNINFKNYFYHNKIKKNN